MANVDILVGQPVQVQAYDGSDRPTNEWTKVKIKYKGHAIKPEALVVDKAEYDFLLPQPHMKAMHLNLFRDDCVTVSEELNARPSQETATVCSRRHNPLCGVKVSMQLPLPISGLAVPFRLKGTVVIQQKLYPLLRERKKDDYEQGYCPC